MAQKVAGLLGAPGMRDGVPQALQVLAEDLMHLRVVVDDENRPARLGVGNEVSYPTTQPIEI